MAAASEQQRYMFYYQRFQRHGDGIKAVPSLRQEIGEARSMLLTALEASQFAVSPDFVAFLSDSVDLIWRCRNVLRWTYAYAFLLPPNSDHRQLLESQQGHLERMTDHVHVELHKFCEQNVQEETAKITEHGDSAILQHWQFKLDMCTYNHALQRFCKQISVQIKQWQEDEELGVAAATSTAASEDVDEAIFGWACSSCTFHNTHASHQRACEMCGAPREHASATRRVW